MNKRELYESIMRNVAIEVKKALNEAEKKSEKQIKEESKASPEEKVDMWMEGTREIKLDLCSPEKLKKYYSICKEKEFKAGVAKIETVAKSRNIKLDKED